MSSVDDWKVEYEQLSEDQRFFIQMGWQATVAVMAVDGLIVGALLAVHPTSRWLGFLPVLGAMLAFLMAGETLKWIKRSNKRVSRLRDYDRAHHFARFYYDERGFLTWPLGKFLLVLMILVGFGLVLYACVLFLDAPLA